MIFALPRRVALPLLGAAFAAGALLATLGNAIAAQPEGGALASCAADLKALCGGIEAGNGKKMRCLMDNQAKLSPACNNTVQTRLDKRAARGAAAVAPAPAAGATPTTKAPIAKANMRACKTDMATFCATVPKGQGGRFKCLADNQAKLTPDCATAVAAVGQQRQAAKGACEDDAAKFCATARGSARMQCLTANKAQVSPACAARIEKREANLAKRASTPKPQ